MEGVVRRASEVESTLARRLKPFQPLVQLPGPQLEPEGKAEVPAHAQRMSSLLAADKEFVPCRVARRAYVAERNAGREAGGRGTGAAQAACTRGGPDSRLWARARTERTLNMLLIVVTLDMSKLSGWLNADA